MVHVNKKFKNKTNRDQVLTCPQSPCDTVLAGLQGPTSLAFSYKRYLVKINNQSTPAENRNQGAKSQKSSLVLRRVWGGEELIAKHTTPNGATVLDTVPQTHTCMCAYSHALDFLINL